MNDLNEQLQSMLKNAAPVEHAATGTGRGPTGKLRNFSAMSEAKFRTVYEAVTSEGNDDEAIAAVREEARSRGIVIA